MTVEGMEKGTVSVEFVRAALMHVGAAAQARVLEKANIPADLIGQSLTRVTAESFASVWMHVAQELDDEFFGLDRRRMKVGSFAMLCHAVIASPTLDKALDHMLRYFGLLLDDLSADAKVRNGEVLVQLNNRIENPAARLFADETYLVMVHGLLCWLAGKRLSPTRLELAHPCPARATEYEVMFTQHLVFDAPVTILKFDAEVLQYPVVQNERSLKVFLRHAPQSVFLKYRNSNSWTAKTRKRLRACVGQMEWPVLEDLADEFNVSPVTLRRKLEAEGCSFQGIKDELRRDAAVHQLCHSTLAIPKIAALLGYSEPSAFHKAFKKWTGSNPGKYRARRPDQNQID